MSKRVDEGAELFFERKRVLFGPLYWTASSDEPARPFFREGAPHVCPFPGIFHVVGQKPVESRTSAKKMRVIREETASDTCD